MRIQREVVKCDGCGCEMDGDFDGWELETVTLRRPYTDQASKRTEYEHWTLEFCFMCASNLSRTLERIADRTLAQEQEANSDA